MPTYQYACTECGHRFEAVQAFTDPTLTDCPVCSGRVRKVFSSVGIVFKGSGFYRTDSRESAKSSSLSGDSATKNGDGAKSESGTSSSSSSETGSSTKATSDSSTSSNSSSTSSSSSKAAAS